MWQFLGLLALFIARSIAAAAPSVTVTPPSLTPGQLAIVRVGPVPETASVAVSLDGAKAPQAHCGDAKDHWCAAVAVPYESKPGAKLIKIETTSEGSTTEASATLTVKKGNFKTTKLTVAPAKVNPPKEAMERIQQEKEELAACLTNSSTTPLWEGNFQLPVDKIVTGGYGSRRMFNGTLQSSHLGTDIRADEKTPIFAANAGTVALAKNMYFAGNLVVVDHGLGVLTGYAHMSRIDVKKGDFVTKGQRLGMAGATGRVTGPHLHWTFRVGDNLLDAAQAIESWRKMISAK